MLIMNHLLGLLHISVLIIFGCVSLLADLGTNTNKSQKVLTIDVVPRVMVVVMMMMMVGPVHNAVAMTESSRC